MNMKLRYPNGMTGRLHLCPIMISCQNTVRESWYVNRKRDLAATQGAIFAKIWARNAGLDIRDSNDRSSGCGIVVTERAEMQDLDSPFQDFPTLKRYPNLRLNLRSKLKKRRGRERERKAPKRNGRGRPLPSPPNPPSLSSSLTILYPFRRVLRRLLLISSMNNSKKFCVAE